MSFEIEIGRPGQFAAFERAATQAFERAALRAADRAARTAGQQIRAAMPGRLKGAIGIGSDLKERGTVYRKGAGFSASGTVYVRGKSERTAGAVKSETEGAIVVPKRGRWLAFPTGSIPKRAGRFKMTPDRYRETGLEEKIGPLVFVPGRGGRALLVVRGPLTVDRFKGGGARRLPRRGRIGGRRKVVRSVVAFILIRQTTRAPRANVAGILAANHARVPGLIADELKKEGI